MMYDPEWCPCQGLTLNCVLCSKPEEKKIKMTELKFNTLQEAKQAAFNGAVRGLASQGWKQCRNLIDGVCSWNRGKQGMHCAVGWLIPWENQKDIRNGGVWRATNFKLLHPALNEWSSDLSSLLGDLQWIHDKFPFPDSMKEQFIKLANQKGLSWPKDVPCKEMTTETISDSNES